MNIEEISRRDFIKLGVFGATVAALPTLACSMARGSGPAMRAYGLRMQGKVDDAQVILEQAIERWPLHHGAHYELARIQMHIALGQMGPSLFEKMNQAQQTIHRAVTLEAEGRDRPQDTNTFPYQFFAGHVNYFQAYAAQMTGEQPNENLEKAIESFEAALRTNPDSLPAMLYLVELYAGFPEKAGGDNAKADHYAVRLERMDSVFGAKARAMFLPEEADRVEYWQQVMQKHPGNVLVMEEIGKAHLRADQVDQAVSWFEQAVEADSEKVSLFLDMSIYHTFKGMIARDDRETQQRHVASGDAAISKYIESEPVLPMLAYAFGVQAKYKMFSGKQEEGRGLLQKAEDLDPYFSKATGAPHPDLFIPPGKVPQNHRYLMRPF